MNKVLRLVFTRLIVLIGIICNAQNPIINTQFTADPTAKVFDGKYRLLNQIP